MSKLTEILDEVIPYIREVNIELGTVDLIMRWGHDANGDYCECARLKTPRLAEAIHARISAINTVEK